MIENADSIAESLGWEVGVDYPVWGHTEIYLKTISKGYLLSGEKPKDAYWRVCTTVAKRLGKPEMASKFFDYIYKGWLNLATPVLSNTGTERGLPISCFGIDVADSIHDIGMKNLEMMLLAKHGGGVGIGINQIRPAGSPIKGNGTSDGVVPFCKIFDSTILATNQGSVRRGAASVNMDIEHGDFWEWLEIREPKGDVNRQSLNLHQCVIVSDAFMQKLEQGDKDARSKWTAILRKRRATGEPYIMYKGNVNRNNPEAYTKNGLKVYMTNICVSGDTLIDIQFENGDIDKVQISQIGALLELSPSIKVLSKNIETGENEWKLITDFGMTEEFAEVYEIEDVNTGRVVKCTGNHKFLTNRGWVEAKDLVESDELVIN
jgi:ribonucleoside-diphosphate reductase alpha chain